MSIVSKLSRPVCTVLPSPEEKEPELCIVAVSDYQMMLFNVVMLLLVAVLVFALAAEVELMIALDVVAGVLALVFGFALP